MRKMNKKASQDAKNHFVIFGGKLLKIVDKYPKLYQLVFKSDNMGVVRFKRVNVPVAYPKVNVGYDSNGNIIIDAKQKYGKTIEPINNKTKGTIVLNFEHPFHPRKSSTKFYHNIKKIHLQVGKSYTIKGFGVLIYQPVKEGNKWYLESSNTYDVCDDTFGIWEAYEDEHQLNPWAKKQLSKYHDRYVWLIHRLSRMKHNLKKLMKSKNKDKAYLYASRYARILDGYMTSFTPMIFSRPISASKGTFHWSSATFDKDMGIEPSLNKISTRQHLLEIQLNKKLTKADFHKAKNKRRMRRLDVNDNGTMISPKNVCSVLTQSIKGLKNHKFN